MTPRAAVVVLLLLLPVAAFAGEDPERDARLARLVFELPREAVLPPDERPGLEDLRRDLADEDPIVRLIAAATLARISPELPGCVPDLVAALDRRGDAFRFYVCEALRRLGPEAAPAAEKLAKLVYHYGEQSGRLEEGWEDGRPYRDTGSAILAALVAIGPASVPHLKELVSPELDYVRPATGEAVARALRMIEGLPPVEPTPPPEPEKEGPPPLPDIDWLPRFEAWVKEYAGGIPPPGEERELVTDPFEELVEHGPAAVPHLLAGIDHGTERVRVACLRALRYLGPAARDAAPGLFELASDEDVLVRSLAVQALGRTGAGDPAWVPKLASFLDPDAPQVGAVRALGSIGPAAAAAEPKLLALLEAVPEPRFPEPPFGDDSVLVRVAAAKALVRISPSPERLVPRLLAAAAVGGTFSSGGTYRGPDPTPHWAHDPDRRRWVDLTEVVLDALGSLGPRVLPVVREHLDDEDPKRREVAVKALTRFPRGSVRGHLLTAARDPEIQVRIAAAGGLRRDGGTLAVEVLAALAADASRSVRVIAFGALRGIGPPAEPAVPALASRLVGTEVDEAHAAYEAIVDIRPDPADLLVPVMLDLLFREDGARSWAIWHLAQAPADIIRTRIREIATQARRGPPGDRRGLLDLIVKAAPESPEARELLRAGLADESPEVVERAIGLVRWKKVGGPGVGEALALHLADERWSTLAAAALAELGAAAVPAEPALRKLLAEGDPAARAAAARALVAAGEVEGLSAPLVSLLAAREEKVRRVAAEVVGKIGGVAEAAGPLRALYEKTPKGDYLNVYFEALATTTEEAARYVLDEVERCRRRGRWWAALRAVPGCGDHAVPTLRRWLESRDISRYYAAARLLGEIGEPALVAVDDLRKLAESGKDQGLSVATEALVALGVDDEIVLPLVARGLTHDWVTRGSATSTVRMLGARIEPILSAVARAVHDQRGLSMQYLLEGVVDTGPVGASITPYLVAALPGGFYWERHQTVWFLGKIAHGHPAALPALRWALRDPHVRVRASAATALGQAFPRAPRAVELLGSALRDAEEEVRRAAIAALEELGPLARPALASILGAVDGGDRGVARRAVRLLGDLAEDADLVRPRLERILTEESAWLVHDALVSLGRIGAPKDQLIPFLTRFDVRLRLGAVRGLKALGLGENELRALLDPLRDDPARAVREEVRAGR